MEKSKNVLREEVAQKYDSTIQPGPVILRPPVGNHEIDLRKITLSEADELYSRGFSMLILKEQPSENESKALLPEDSQPAAQQTASKKRSK